MSRPQVFDFGLPPVDPRHTTPTGTSRIPINGKEPTTRHASSTGARHAVHMWGVKQSAYLQLLNTGGSLTDNEVAALLKWPLSSVCSIRNSLLDKVETDGFETATWDGGRTTRRTRWRLHAVLRNQKKRGEF